MAKQRAYQRPWGRRHPWWTALYAFVALGFLAGQTAASITIGVILLAHVAFLLWNRGGRSPAPASARLSDVVASPPPKRVVAPGAAHHQPVGSALDRDSWIDLQKGVAPDEVVRYMIPGMSGAGLVATDRRLWVRAPGGGFRRHPDWVPYDYDQVEDVTLERDKRNYVLRVASRIPAVITLDPARVDSVVPIVPALRRDIGTFQAQAALASQPTSQSSPSASTQNDEPTSEGSAFTATSQQQMPSRSLASAITVRDMLAMSPTDFEEFCAKVLAAMGYQGVKRVGGAGDLAADIVATDPFGRSTIAQCKRYKPGSKIGSPTVQTFIGMKNVHHHAERGIFITTADYSIPAVRLAKQHDIVLVDGDDLGKLSALVIAPKPVPALNESIRFCGNCGREFSNDARFCPGCGNPRA